MEIKNFNSSMINKYKNVAEKKAPAKADSGAVVKADNRDKIEFDFSKVMDFAKADIKSSVETDANAARVAELQQKYAGDNCPVDPGLVADSILNA